MSEHMTYDEIMNMICKSCYHNFDSGYKNNYKEVIESTTQIYIAQMQIEAEREGEKE